MDLMNIAFIIVIIIFLIGGFKRAYELRNHPDEDDENLYTAPPPAMEQSIHPPEGYLIYEGSRLNISRTDVHDILIKHCPYYLPLLPHLKTKFLIRLMRFLEVKMFVLPKETRFREMPVLASAAAVQLTFGLDHFLLPSFQSIFIHEEEYFAHDSFRVKERNAEDNVINIAWNYLLNGLKDETDSENAGLHEMAHALWYQNTVAGPESAHKFCNHFDKVMEEGKEIYQLKNKGESLFSDYAYKNLQELWAESVELFFEKPEAFKISHPHLFDCLTELINQNPLQKENPALD